MERLGMDENFLDVIEFVNLWLLSDFFGDRNYLGYLYNGSIDNSL